jgi:DNA-binding HxlR family transcriptional regulator
LIVFPPTAEAERLEGTETLLLLSIPFNVTVVMDLAASPRSLAEIGARRGSPPVTTMRGRLRSLARAGVVEKRRQAGFPGYVDYRLTAAGQDLPELFTVLATWLEASPGGSIAFGSDTAKGAIKALVEASSSGIARALARSPLSLTELSREVTCLSYPSLERRLSTMRRLGLVEARSSRRRGIPFVTSDWMRAAAELLAAAAAWERRAGGIRSGRGRAPRPLSRSDGRPDRATSEPAISLP